MPSASRRVTGSDGLLGHLLQEMPEDPGTEVGIELDGGTRIVVPASALRPSEDGGYLLSLSLRDVIAQVIPIVEERLRTRTRVVDTARVRVRKRVSERVEDVIPDLMREQVDVERVPVHRQVDARTEPYTDGDTLIVPLFEEVLVVEKRLVLREEIRIRKKQVPAESPPRQVALRREDLEIERIPLDADETPAPRRPSTDGADPRRRAVMANMVVAYFEDYTKAQRAVTALEEQGFTANDVSMVAAESTRDAAHGGTVRRRQQDQKAERTGIGAGVGAAVGGLAGLLAGIGALAIPGVGPVVAAGPIAGLLVGAGGGAATGGLIGALTRLGVPEDHARYYARGIQKSGTLVTVRADDTSASRAADLLNRSGAFEVEPGTEQRRADSAGASSARATAVNRPIEDERAIPIVEEHLEIGKKEVATGGVRVYSGVVETPVHEDVTLREEHVHVERRPVDRPIDPRALDEFREEEIELTERAEQVVVGKTARVVEEVVVGREVGERVETVSDTVRRTEVRVEEMGRPGTPTAFDDLNDDYRSDWNTTYRARGGAYDDLMPAYRYGHDLAGDARYRDRDWSQVESHVRTDWEKDRPGTWDQVKDAVHYAWNKVRGRTSSGSKR